MVHVTSSKYAQEAEDKVVEGDFELASLISVRANSLEEIQEHLPEDTALLEYFYHGDRAYIFGVTRMGDPVVKELDISAVAAQLRTSINTSRWEFSSLAELLSKAEGDDESDILRDMSNESGISQGAAIITDWLCYRTYELCEEQTKPEHNNITMKLAFPLDEAYERLAVLYDKLIRPMQELVDSAERLVIVPHGILHWIPFSAFIDVPEGKEQETKELIHTGKAQYLIETRSITLAPSGSVVDICKRKPRPQPKTCLAVRQPALGADVASIRNRCRLENYFIEETQSLDSENATIPKFMSAIEKMLFSVVHFGTHGILNADNGLYSGLAMSKHTEDGFETDFLYARDILNIFLHATLVFLRACMTGLGRIHPGDDIIGLTRAFFYAGTPSIIASLWEVDDEESWRLTEFFYDEWLKCGDKAEALRQAQLRTMRFYHALMKDKHPYRWAGFALYGDWE